MREVFSKLFCRQIEYCIFLMITVRFIFLYLVYYCSTLTYIVNVGGGKWKVLEETRHRRKEERKLAGSHINSLKPSTSVEMAVGSLIQLY